MTSVLTPKKHGIDIYPLTSVQTPKNHRIRQGALLPVLQSIYYKFRANTCC
uniref:Uncharacterized protein n=1 Tax=Arundo donax TaxID=35708 RepID=A0A0A9DK83_ARUDO